MLQENVNAIAFPNLLASKSDNGFIDCCYYSSQCSFFTLHYHELIKHYLKFRHYFFNKFVPENFNTFIFYARSLNSNALNNCDLNRQIFFSCCYCGRRYIYWNLKVLIVNNLLPLKPDSKILFKNKTFTFFLYVSNFYAC